MTFKAHKKDNENNNISSLYPVNDILMNPNSKYFCCTVGGDGVIYFWDFEKKNKIKEFNFNN